MQAKSNDGFEMETVVHDSNGFPVRPALAWRNLSYQVEENFFNLNIFKRRGKDFNNNQQTSPKRILSHLSGSFQCGSLNALMGPSGAGKTTLLNVLSGNLTVGQLRKGLTPESEIYLGQNKGDPDHVNEAISVFIPQHVQDTMVARMQVGHALQYAFRFKNGHGPSERDMNAHIDRVMDELLLPEQVLRTEFRNCSGGEQKRVAIAQELMSLTMPKLMFIDEPTTGLDSNAALLVMECLKRLTKSNRICIITSIHSPNNDIMKLFDQLYILAKGGVCIYSGDPDQELKQCLDSPGMNNFTMDAHEAPIEAMLRVACNGRLRYSTSLLELIMKTLFWNRHDRFHCSKTITEERPKSVPSNHQSTQRCHILAGLQTPRCEQSTKKLQLLSSLPGLLSLFSRSFHY